MDIEAFRSNLEAWRRLSTEEQISKIGERLPDREPDPSNGRIKWGIVSPGLGYGGAEAWLEALVKAVGDKVSWQGLCLLDGRSRETSLGDAMPISGGQAQAIELAQRCDAVLTWSPTPFLAGHTRLVYVSHLPVGELPPADGYVAVSELAVQPAGCPVIWNGVDANRLMAPKSRDEMFAAWGVPPGAKVAGYLGRLAPEKNPRAMARLVRSLPEPWHVVVVGAGRVELEPTDRLHVVGPEDHPGNALNAFDVLVVPSKYESFGLTLVEGLWLDKPVVSTAVGVALLHPELVNPIPFDADGPTLASAVMTATARPLSVEFREKLSMTRFGREWTDYLTAKPTPSLLAMAGSFLSSMATQLVHVLQGGDLHASSETQDERKATCLVCPSHEPADACTACGCGTVKALSFVGLDLSWKRSLSTSVCPDGKW